MDELNVLSKEIICDGVKIETSYGRVFHREKEDTYSLEEESNYKNIMATLKNKGAEIPLGHHRQIYVYGSTGIVADPVARLLRFYGNDAKARRQTAQEIGLLPKTLEEKMVA